MSNLTTQGSIYDPTSVWKAQQNDALVAQQGLGMPGYEQMSNLYNANYGQFGQQLEDSPDYMDRWSGMVDPNAFMQNMPGMGGEGESGPLGADQLAEFGEGAYELFDKFKPGMEYIAENQGVGEQELSNRLGTASGGMQRNIQNQEQQQIRNMQRMGIDPSSGAWQAGAGERAIQGAQGLSGLQQNVRSDARNEDWQQRMQAAGIGLNVAGQGTDALGRATSSYDNARNAYANMYGNYASGLSNMGSLTENARQYDKSYGAGLAQGMTGAVPSYQGTMSSASQMNPWLRGAGNTGGSGNWGNTPDNSGGYNTLPSGLSGV